MRQLIKGCLFVLLSFGAGYSGWAQGNAGTDTGPSLGLRLTPDGGGFTGKFFLDNDFALEGQLNAGGLFAFDGESFNAVGLLEYHIRLDDPAWRLFFGGGAHIGVWQRGNRDDLLLGMDAIGGVEYTFKKIPLSLSGDFKPAVNFSPSLDLFAHNCLGISARFLLNGR